MAGQPAPSDVQMTITPFFLKSQEQRTFVPFVLDVKGAPPGETAMYVRVVNPSAQPDPKTKKVEYPVGRYPFHARRLAWRAAR